MSTNRRIYLDFNATSAAASPAARAAMTDALDAIGEPVVDPRRGPADARRASSGPARRSPSLLGRPREEVVFTSGGTEANVAGRARRSPRSPSGAACRGSSRRTAIEHPSLRGAVAALAPGWRVADARRSPTPAARRVRARSTTSSARVEPARSRPSARPPRARPRRRGPGRRQARSPTLARRHDRDLRRTRSAARRASARSRSPTTTGLPLVERRPPGARPPAGHREHARHRRRSAPRRRRSSSRAGRPSPSSATTLEARPPRDLGARIHGADRPRIGGTINAAFAGALGGSIVIALDLAGIAASTGAACTSGSIEPSPVLLGLGMAAEQAREAVRFSLGPPTTEPRDRRGPPRTAGDHGSRSPTPVNVKGSRRRGHATGPTGRLTGANGAVSPPHA